MHSPAQDSRWNIMAERPIEVAPDGIVWLLTDLGFVIVDPEVAVADR